MTRKLTSLRGTSSRLVELTTTSLAEVFGGISCTMVDDF